MGNPENKTHKQIQTVSLIGAGAVGAYFIAGLQEKEGVELTVVASGDRAQRLSGEGLMINEQRYALKVKTPAEAAGCDLLLIATKYSGLRDILPDVRTIVSPDTVVMSLLNGIDSEEILCDAVDRAQIVHAYMEISSRRKGNDISYQPEKTNGLFFGEADTSEKTARLSAIEELFTGSGVRFTCLPDIMSGMWTKFCLNIAYNLPQAVLNLGFGAYFDSAHVGLIRDRLEAEVRAVAKEKGITVNTLKNTRESCAPDTRFSTLQDLDAGRHTEVDMFLGVLMQMAKEHGIPVPFAEYTFHAIKALEEKNDGIIR